MNTEAPAGWFIAGSQRADYTISVDRRVRHSGLASGAIVAKPSQHEGFGTIMQNIKADAYRGQRIRLSAYVKGEQIREWAGLWMRVDRSDAAFLSFANMENRKITGTTAWTRYALVLDVPEEGALIAFGLLLAGQGQAWLDDAQIELVAPTVATTETAVPTDETKEQERLHADYARRLPEMLKHLPTAPVNLDFETP